MQKISKLQEYFPTDFSGLVTENHLGYIHQLEPQMASNLTTQIRQINFGMDLETFLRQFPVKYLDSSEQFRWMLQGDARKNIPLVAAYVNGSAVTALSKAGIANSRFTLTFPERWFSDQELIEGELNEKYPIRICSEPKSNGVNWDYECELMTGDATLFIPYDQLLAGKRFSRGWAPVSRTLSNKGATPNYTSPFAMSNEFTMIRMQDTRPGDMIDKPVCFSWVVLNDNGKPEVKTTWMQYADWEFERQFQEMKNKALMFGTINRTANNTFLQKSQQGFVIKQGSGIREQMESSNTTYYSTFDIDWLTDILMDLCVGKLNKERREFVLRTGEWGMLQFHKALESHSSLYTPNNTEMRFGKMKNNGLSYGGQFQQFIGPNGIIVNLMHESMYDDPERNKIIHPSGKGFSESYNYDILDVSNIDGEPNIQLVYQKGQEDIRGYEPGFRSPWQLGSKGGNIMASPTDGYTIHRGSVFGAIIKDPTKTARIIHNSLA